MILKGEYVKNTEGGTSYWLSVIGYWLLVIGYWLLVIGYRYVTNNQ